jgi:hypothetical protein
MIMNDSIDTRAVANYRVLRFDSVEDCIAEVQRLAAAGREGSLRTTGNWSPGQIMAHLASWIEYGFTGYPLKPPPFFIRWILRLRLKKMLQHGMPRGVRIPGTREGTFGMDEMEISEAASRLVKALQRLQNRDEAPFDSPAFGAMSHDDRIRLNLRHAELHLGYLSD